MAAVEVEGLAGRSHRRRLLLLLLLFVNLPHMSDSLYLAAPPHQPEITRIVLENLKILVVYFDPVRDLESLNINTTWSLITSGLGIIRTTPCDVQEEYVCQTSDTFHLIGAPNGASVTITAENEYGNSSTTERQVKVEEYVQLYPVAVKTERVNSTWVQLYWTIEMTLEMHSFGGIHYNLSFQSDFFQPVLFNFTCEVTYAVQNEGCRTIRKVVGGLQPYTDYNLTWQSHPVKKGYWSKPATTQFQTLEDVPKSAPPIQAWQYSYVRELDNTHRTFIYPQDLRPEDKAGVITEYKYLVEGEAEPRRAKGSPRSLTIDSYDPEGPGMAVYLWACTRMGCSKNSSTIILPGAADRTTIVTDCHRAYCSLPTRGFPHERVNHSRHFVDPTTGVNTNLIENLWSWMKRKLPKVAPRDGLALQIKEYWYKRDRAPDHHLYEAFLRDCAAFDHQRRQRSNPATNLPSP